jgi:hypothetical protein
MPRDERDSLTISTLGDLIDTGATLYVNCDGGNCWNSNKVDLEKLARKHGREYGCMATDLRRLRWRCQKCQSRSVTFTQTPGGKQYSAIRDKAREDKLSPDFTDLDSPSAAGSPSPA